MEEKKTLKEKIMNAFRGAYVLKARKDRDAADRKKGVSVVASAINGGAVFGVLFTAALAFSGGALGSRPAAAFCPDRDGGGDILRRLPFESKGW